MLAEMFGPESIEQVGNEFKFPSGSYYSTYGSDEYGVNYSAWAEAKLNPDFPEKAFVRLVQGWDPTSIVIQLQEGRHKQIIR